MGVDSDDWEDLVDGLGFCTGKESVLGGCTSTSVGDFDNFGVSSSIWDFEVGYYDSDILGGLLMIVAASTTIGIFKNIRVSHLERISLSAKSYWLVDRDGKSKEKDLLVLCFGEMLIVFLPTVDGVSFAEALAFEKILGGAPANVAVGMARAGGLAAYVGKVGNDEFRHMMSSILKQNNVDITALAFVKLRAYGECDFIYFRNPSAHMLFRESELNKNLLKKASIFDYGSELLIEKGCRSTQLAATKIVKKAGCILCYVPNMGLAMWPSAEAAKKEIMSIWDQADIIKISGEENSFLTDAADSYNDDVVLKKLFEPYVKHSLVPDGSEGCRYYTKDFKGKVGGVKVNCIVTTGAGDAIVRRLLNSFTADLNKYKDVKMLREAIFFANACGALTVTERGAIPVLPAEGGLTES